MKRDFTSSSFLGSGIESEEDNDPRMGLVNLADVMLVFACGLMLALVTYWNLDVSSMQEVTKGAEMAEVRDIEELEGNSTGTGGFVEKGIVYQDPMTGKYYMLQEDMNESEKAEDDNASDSKNSNSSKGNGSENGE